MADPAGALPADLGADLAPHPFALDETTGRCSVEGCGLVQQATIHDAWNPAVQARYRTARSDQARQRSDAYRRAEPPDGRPT